ncbi:MAG: tyrosine-protein kinase [Baekduia sp.]|jgi:capsular exopolysaccharide synthesis family protein|nr:tyrosine-protein kinase [Baekduia sp.]
MAAPEAPRPATAAWLPPRTEQQGFVRYFATVRERWWLVLLVTVIATAAAAVYAEEAPKVYKAEADVLVIPAVQGDSATNGLGLLTDSSDPTQVTTTAARVLFSESVADLVRRRMKLSDTPEGILSHITIDPIAQSNLIAVTASASSAQLAQRLANGYAQAAIDRRTDLLHTEIDALVPSLRARLTTLPPADRTGSGSLGERITNLEVLRAAPDPTLRIASRPSLPVSPSSPKPKLALAAGILAGLILGLGAAFASQTLDPRLRREDQLRELFRLPMLARVPDRRSQRGPTPLSPGVLPPDVLEAYRTLRATLSAAIGEDRRSILVTSSASGEGKTTTALNLAYAYAHAGHEVILIEADLRRPTIATAIGVRPVEGLGSVLIGESQLTDALFTVPELGDHLDFLLAGRGGASLVDRLSLPGFYEVVDQALKMADYVIIDSPPLTEVVDALPLAQRVDAVLMVARLNVSRLNRLADLGEMLAQGGIVPAGIAVVGSERTIESSYYQLPPGPKTKVPESVN